jgi:NAD(P)-dependent dehydrogenase (short-subunit alcohol dehydrogenase family)
MKLGNKVALITGVGSGMGPTGALLFAPRRLWPTV